MDFYDWLINVKKLSNASASKYDLVIRNRISDWLPSYEKPQNIIDFEALKQLIYSLDIYQERNRVGNNMYSAALVHYGNYLKDYGVNDAGLISEDQDFTSEVQRLIKVRLTQYKFRKNLFELNQFCAITGFKSPQFLIASHIKPWSKSNDQERLDKYNGLLLTPNFDRLFDRGFISFKKNGEIIISNKLSSEEKLFFNIPKIAYIGFKVDHYKYIEFHSDTIFQK